MGSLSTARTFGGIGSLMILLFPFAPIGTFLAVVGWILVLIAVSNIADVYGEKTMMNNTILAMVFAVVGFVTFAGVAVLSAIHFANENGLKIFSLTGYTNLNSTALSSGHIAGLGGLLVGVFIGLALLCAFSVLSAVFLRRVFTKLASTLNVRMFETAGFVYLIGAALTIVIVGILVLLIAVILMAIAFFSMPDDTSREVPTAQVIPPPPSGTV